MAAGINLRQQVLGGIMAASAGDAAEQARLLFNRDCRGVLLAPPFYFKNVTDEGLYRWFSQVFERIGQRARDVILYNIPSVTQVELSVPLVSRLKAAFPDVVEGVKDSGSDWVYTKDLLNTHDDLLILIGNERHLAPGVRLGAQGAISGLANLFPEILLKMIETGEDDIRIDKLENELLELPFTPAVKALLAHRQEDPAWLNLRPPSWRYRRLKPRVLQRRTTKLPADRANTKNFQMAEAGWPVCPYRRNSRMALPICRARRSRYSLLDARLASCGFVRNPHSTRTARTLDFLST